MKTIHALPIAMIAAFLNASACTSSFPAGIDNSSYGGSGPVDAGAVDPGTGGVAGAAATDTGGAAVVGGTTGAGAGGVAGAAGIDVGLAGTNSTGGTTGCGSAVSSSPLAMLPANNSIGTWTLSGAPVLASTDTALYNMIDGAAPKYIDLGWVSSAYATYRQSGSSIQVAIHDMGNAENARSLFTYELPVSRLAINGLPNAVVDMSLPTAFSAYAWSGQYVIEVSIAVRSDAALTYVEMFTLSILNRGCVAGTDAGGGTGGVAGAGGTDASVAPDLAPDGGTAAVEFASVSVGYNSACGVRIDGTIACWGDNIYGQSTPPAGTFTSVSTLGVSFACGLRTDATIACWGQYGAYPAPPTGSFASVDTGYSHACAVRVDRTVVCWGADFDGTPPAGTFASVSAGDDFVCGVRSDGTLVCWGANVVVHHATPPTGTFRSVSAAPLFACGLRTDGTITCWGDNSPGTPPGGAFASVSAGDGFACGVRTDGTITCWGDNSSGQATPPAGTFASVSAGYGFACGVRTDSTVACWGKNSSGEATPPVADAAGADASVIPDLAPVLPLDGGACPWPASLTSSNDASTIGCWAHINTNVCEIPAGDVVDSHGTILGPDGTPVADASCQHSCIASEYLVWCMGDETSSSPFTVPEPDSSLGCRVLAGPTAALTAYFCCPCGPGQ